MQMLGERTDAACLLGNLFAKAMHREARVQHVSQYVVTVRLVTREPVGDGRLLPAFDASSSGS